MGIFWGVWSPRPRTEVGFAQYRCVEISTVALISSVASSSCFGAMKRVQRL